MQGCGQGWREGQWGQWYKKIGYKKGKGILWILYEEGIREGKLDVEKIRTSFPQSWKVIVSEMEQWDGERNGWIQSIFQSKLNSDWGPCLNCTDFLRGVRSGGRISRTIFKMLAPIIGCSLIKGPWRSSIFVGGRETDHGYESSLDRWHLLRWL